MAYSQTGSVALTTSLPLYDKTVVEVNGVDAVVGWTSSVVLSRHYLNADWSGFSSPNQTFVTQSGAAFYQRKGRLFGNTAIPSNAWLVLPYLTTQAAPHDLETRFLDMSGTNPTVDDQVQVHVNAIPAGESFAKFFPMTAGIATFSTLANGVYQMRGFSYSSEGGTVLATADIDTTTALTSTDYGSTFPSSTVFTSDKDSIYTAYLDGSTMRVHYLDMTVSLNQVAFTTYINTTSSLPTSLTAVKSASVVTGPSGPLVGILSEDATSVYLTLTNTDAGDFQATTHTLTGVSPPISASGAGLYAFSTTLAFCQVPGSSFIGEVTLANSNLLINANDFSGGAKVPIVLEPNVVNLGLTVDTNALYGMTLGNVVFGPDTSLPNLNETSLVVDRVRNTAPNAAFWTASSGSDGSQTLTRYLLTEAPPDVRFEPDMDAFNTWFTGPAGTSNQDTNNTLYSTNFIPGGEGGQNVYYYVYDGTPDNRITDGGNDMYDGGNIISFSGTNFITVSEVGYGTSDDQTTKGYYVSGENFWPHSVFGWTKETATVTLTVTGNLGSDGGGSRTQMTGTLTTPIKGRAVEYWAAMNYGQNQDPLIGDTFFTVESTSWASEITSTSFDLDIPDKSIPTMVVSATGKNFVLFHLLLSRHQAATPSTPLSTTQLEAIIENYVDTMEGFGA